jgi:NitT/TauT family transport system substrate-binding protein
LSNRGAAQHFAATDRVLALLASRPLSVALCAPREVERLRAITFGIPNGFCPSGASSRSSDEREEMASVVGNGAVTCQTEEASVRDRRESWSRRQFVSVLTLAGTTGLLGMRPEPAAAEPPPETTRIRVVSAGGACQAPKWAAGDLLRAEGFADVQYTHKRAGFSVAARLKALDAGEADFDLMFVPNLILGIEAGQPLVIVAGGHIGCFELFGGDRVRAIRDLKGKAIGVREVGSFEQLFLAIILSYVGLDPSKDARWVSHSPADAGRLLAGGKIDAFLGFPPHTQELRAKKIGHILLNSTIDPPWRDHFCCMVVANREFVRRYPAATKRVVRALMKANQVCALASNRTAQLVVDQGPGISYEYALQMMKEIPYGAWREYDPEATIRFYALRLHEAGMIKSTPQKIIAQGTDWRFLNELKKELKG